jgi:hypothetical protein
MAEARASNPLVEQFKKGGVASELRLMAAQGALPLGPIDLLDLLQHLLGDAEAEIREQAQQTMAAVPKEELLPVGKDRSTPAPILAWILGNRLEADVLEGVLQNTSTSDEAIEAHAPTLPMELAELVVINQVRPAAADLAARGDREELEPQQRSEAAPARAARDVQDRRRLPGEARGAARARPASGTGRRGARAAA